MQTPSYLNRLLQALVFAEKRAIAPLKPKCDAVPFFIYQQEAFPYFTNRIGEETIPDDSPLDPETRLYAVVARLVIGHLGTGYKGENESLLYDLIPLVEDEFRSNRWLIDEEGTELVPELDAIGLVTERTRGLSIFINSGIQAQQVGTEFLLLASFSIDR